ncbi:MAG: hypothetical protein F3742_05495 [Nitrospinae bacterium]|nr:hypothetical protein [Nitrospinota bacterium]MZH14210.1 hypothetical protein [Nitrospinota bacterium]
MMERFFISTVLLLFLFVPEFSLANKDEVSQCHANIKPLHQKRERVAELDGIWGLFEKNRELQGHSVIAINLDRKVNSIIFHLEYLCDTLNGIPMNEVARYVRDGIHKKGEEGFRKELIILGKSEAEIDIWFEFTRFSLKNRKRSLNPEFILESIQKSIPHIDAYESLAAKIHRREIDETIPEKVSDLTRELDNLFEKDNYLNQALAENANIPYVDINESTGGS